MALTRVLAFLALCMFANALRKPTDAIELKRRAGGKDGHRAHRREPYRQILRNDGNMQYTADVNVGGQRIAAILDTGSFDFVVFARNCSGCGAGGQFDGSESNTYEAGELTSDQYYGSGSTNSHESWDTVTLGHLKAQRQMFWEVFNADMAVLYQSSFQAIMGVGPPKSATSLAKDELEYQQQGSPDDADWVRHYQDILDHTEAAPAFVENSGVKAMSICLGRENGSDGYFMWDEPHDFVQPFFVEVPIVGNLYWSAELTNIAFDGEVLGCEEACNAVVDTGTSLISAPTRVIEHLSKRLTDFLLDGGDCSNLDGLPSLEFNLGGHRFTLPPTAFIGDLSGEAPAELREQMMRTMQATGSSCTLMIMAMDETDPDYGELWVLGLPFFREYYTTFVFDDNYEAHSMRIARASEDCNPQGETFMRTRGPVFPKRALQVDVGKLRAPRWRHKQMARAPRFNTKLR